MKSMIKLAPRDMMIPRARARDMRREKKLPRISWGTRSRIQEFQLQWEMAEMHPYRVSATSRTGTAAAGPKRNGERAMTTQKSRAIMEAPTQINRRLRTFSTTEMAGIWISSASGGIAASSPITVLDAPSWRPNATRKTPLVSVTMACVASPSLKTYESPFCMSSSFRVSFGFIMAKTQNR
jgi:hypothetical protein